MAALALVSAVSIKKYDGPLPVQFNSSEGGDAFMERAIREYGEVVEKNGEQKIYINKENAHKLAQQVWDERNLKDVKKFVIYHKYDSDQQLESNWNHIWSHYDVLSEGKITVDQLPGMFRMVAGDTSMQLN